MRKNFEIYFTKLWYSNNKPNALLRGLSKVFDRQRKQREKKLKSNWQSKKPLPVPVIIVGNISVGGTGKTPVVLFLIKTLRDMGHSVGVISRGYGGSLSKTNSVVLSKASTAAEVGDEALMIHQLTSVPFAVGRDRVDVAETLLSQHPQISVIISDDGLQHYQLQRDLEVVIVDGQRGFGNSYLLPAGPLREPVTRLDSVDLVLVNGRSEHASLHNIKSLQFDLQPQKLKKLNSECESRELQYFANKTVHAFAGIGNPERFFKLLETAGLQIIRHSLADHALMPQSFFNERKNDILIMTEKDAVKYNNIIAENFWFLPVEVQMSTTVQATVLELITAKLREMKNDL